MAMIPRISDAEWDVMKVLWERGAAPAADVVAALAGHKDWSPRTVKTLLNRLVRKGALEYEVNGRHYLYRARVARDACVRRETRSFLSRVFDGAAAPSLARFIEAADLSGAELRQLRDMLDATHNAAQSSNVPHKPGRKDRT
jgi:BlaI family penicillinase repressor